MGTQWPGMGRDLMQMEAFRATVARCSEALKPFGFNVYELLMNGNEKTFDSPLNSSICMTTIQVQKPIKVFQTFFIKKHSTVLQSV